MGRRWRGCFAVVFVLISFPVGGWSAGCKVLPEHTPTDAELVFQNGEHAKAASMLQEELGKTPNDPEKASLLIRALLWQRKTGEASDVVDKALAAHPDSAALLTEKAEVLFRQGKPMEAQGAIAAALKADPCFPRAFLMYAWLMLFQSKNASYSKAIQTAHQLDPHDAEFRSYWWNTLPRPQRAAAIQEFVDSGTVKNGDAWTQIQEDLADLKDRASEPPQPCTLTSASRSAEIPLQEFIAERNGDLAAAGRALSVEMDGHKGLLALSTGVSGIRVSRALAEHAGLKPLGSNLDAKRGYRAHVDRIQIGGLEFKDCMVRVVERAGRDRDGLIGTDVFSQFLLTVDFPMRKLKVEPLPQQSETGPPALTTMNQAAYNSQSGSDPSGASSQGTELPQLPDRYIAPEMKDWIPVYRMGSSLMLPVSLHPPDIKIFLVDTGLPATIVSQEAAREVTRVDTNASRKFVNGNGQISDGYVADALDLRFGGISKHAVGVPAADLNTAGLFGLVLRISGVLGADILEELTIHIDYRDGLVKFEYDPKRGYHPTNR